MRQAAALLRCKGRRPNLRPVFWGRRSLDITKHATEFDILSPFSTRRQVHTMKQALRLITLVLSATYSINAIADPVLIELSRRAQIPEVELTQYLADCTASQLSMNICSFQRLIAAELTLNSNLQSIIQQLPNSCKNTLMESQKKWTLSRDSECRKTANEDAMGGTMFPVLYSSCQTISTQQRNIKILTILGCAEIP